jgi:hypothetical protein
LRIVKDLAIGIERIAPRRASERELERADQRQGKNRTAAMKTIQAQNLASFI